jgi:hypothetical protein
MRSGSCCCHGRSLVSFDLFDLFDLVCLVAFVRHLGYACVDLHAFVGLNALVLFVGVVSTHQLLLTQSLVSSFVIGEDERSAP